MNTIRSKPSSKHLPKPSAWRSSATRCPTTCHLPKACCSYSFANNTELVEDRMVYMPAGRPLISTNTLLIPGESQAVNVRLTDPEALIMEQTSVRCREELMVTVILSRPFTDNNQSLCPALLTAMARPGQNMPFLFIVYNL